VPVTTADGEPGTGKQIADPRRVSGDTIGSVALGYG
jgi:hypothetical protein